MLTELILAVRSMTRRPGFFFLATLTLALGIGVNSALFSLLDAVFFRPLPLRDSERLLRIEATSSKATGEPLSYPEYEEIASACPAFEELIAVGRRGVTLRDNGESRVILIHYVSDNFFEAMGIPIHVGRNFSRHDAGDASTPEVIINHHLWQQRLGARRDVIGSAIQLNDTLFTVAGVTPPGFVGLDRIVRTDVWVRVSQASFVGPWLREELADRHRRWFDVYARLAPSASRDQARAQLHALAGVWEREDAPQYAETGLRLTSLDESRQKAIREGMILLALPALVLLIACANVANLLLAFSEGRRRENAIRAALGASGRRLLRQLLAESLVLTSFGTAAGLLLAAWLLEVFPVLVPPGMIMLTLDGRFDGRMLGFSTVLLAASTILVVLAPALRGTRPDLVADLKTQAGHQRTAAQRFRTQHLIMAAQMAIGVMVVVAGTLMVRSLWHSANLRPGFDTAKQVATFYLSPSLKGYSAEATYRFFEESKRRLEALSSVRRASYGIRLPAQGNEAGWAADVVIPGREPPPGKDAFHIRYTMVGPNYFEVMGTRILRGRGIQEADRPGGAPVVIINETMAKRFWPGEIPIGETILTGLTRKTPPIPREIVGIAEDIKISDLYEDPEMYIYVPYAQDPQGFGLLLVEVEGEAESIFGAATAEIARVDPGLPVLDAGSLHGHMQLVLFEERRDASIALGVALLALVLTAVGIYGLVTMVIGYRTREIGLRIVLGANRKDILWVAMNRGFSPALVGSGVGIAGALVVTRLLESRLHGVDTHDPLSFMLGVALLIFIALVASLVPVFRATRLDPAVTMRYE